MGETSESTTLYSKKERDEKCNKIVFAILDAIIKELQKPDVTKSDIATLLDLFAKVRNQSSVIKLES